MALTLSSPELSASIVAVLEGVFQTLGFQSCQRRKASVQVSPSYLLPLPSAPPGASPDPGLPFTLTLGLPWGAN